MVAEPQLSDATALRISGTSPVQFAEAAIVWLGAHVVIVGAVVSLTVMVCDALLELPQASVAVHVRVITLLQLEPGLLCVSLNVIAAELQLSLAVGLADAGTVLKH